MGQTDKAVPELAKLIEHRNLLTGMYAIRALEQLGPVAKTASAEVKRAEKSPYEFTRRFARRLAGKWGL